MPSKDQFKYEGKFVLRHYAYPSEFLTKRANDELFVPYDQHGNALFELFRVISTVFRKMHR